MRRALIRSRSRNMTSPVRFATLYWHKTDQKARNSSHGQAKRLQQTVHKAKIT